MSRALCTALAAVAMLSSCVFSEDSDVGDDCGDTCDVDSDVPVSRRRDALLDNLRALSHSSQLLFGQQAFNINGIAPKPWKARAGAVGRSDVADLVGRHPSLLGIDVWNLAIKPETWDVRPAVYAEAARFVAERGGAVTMSWHLRGCDRVETESAFWAEGNEQCLCRLANDATYARQWLLDGKLRRFADALVRYQLDEVPIIFRPLHEHSGGWFWWGADYWDCDGAVRGQAAYQRVFRMIVDYLRVERGLDNLLIAYSPGGLGRNWFDFSSLQERYLEGYPGDNYVDILGIDLYYQDPDDASDETSDFADYLEVVTRLAHARQKAAALTETGDANLLRNGASDWYERQLLALLRDARVQVAYVQTWDNRALEDGLFYVPTGSHPGVDSFERFFDASETVFLGQGPELYRSPTMQYPTCGSCASDKDGDGWGWESGKSCVMASWCLAR